jgi:hypothetical protein
MRGFAMNIEYFHASKYGNGAMVAEEFKKQMAAKEVTVMNQILQEKGLVKVTEDKIQVNGIKRPLEENWQKKVEAFVSRIPLLP